MNSYLISEINKETIDMMKEIISQYENNKIITKEYFESCGINKHALKKVGSRINFTMNNGEDVEAMVVRVSGIEDIALLIHVDSLRDQYPMNKACTTKGGYKDSYLRKVLNSEILSLYPSALKKSMIPFMNGDYLRIPSRTEIFGANGHKRLEPMKDIRNVKSLYNLFYEWYWLQEAQTDISFATVSYSGKPSTNLAARNGCVRPLFQISLI